MHRTAARLQPALRRAGLLIVIFSLLLGIVTAPQASAAEAAAVQAAGQAAMAAPIITLHPADQQVCSGETVALTSESEPDAALQWQLFDGTVEAWYDIPGETSSPYTFTAYGTMRYHAVFTNLDGSAISDPATVTVYSQPYVGSYLSDLTAAYGMQFTFSSSATGDLDPGVQWQIASASEGPWEDISGATNPNYTVTFDKDIHPELFYIRALWSNSCGDSPSNAAMVELSDPPDLTLSLTHEGDFYQNQKMREYRIIITNDGGVPIYGGVTLTIPIPSGLSWNTIGATASCYGVSTITCYFTETLAPGESYTTVELRVDVNADAASPQILTATVSGDGEVNTSNNSASDSTIILTSPKISQQPTAKTVIAGSVVTFSAAAGPNTTVQWQSGPSAAGPWTDLPGKTAGTLTLTAAESMNGTYYRAVFTNPGGTLASSAARLTVTTKSYLYIPVIIRP